MGLDEMLDGAAAGTTTVEPGWGQGRATYGGLVGGLLAARAEALCGDAARPLRSATVTFVGPVVPGGALVDGTVLRAGSSATQVETRIVQEDEVRATLTAGFAADRPGGEVVVDPAPRNPRPEVPDPEGVPAIGFIPGVTPEFFKQLDLRQTSGGIPFAGGREPDFGGWMRFADAPARLGARELVTLADAWPPSVAPMLRRPVPVSTFAWTIELLAPDLHGPDAPEAFWQYAVRTLAARNGYAHTSPGCGTPPAGCAR